MEASCVEQFIEYLPDAVFILEPDGSVAAVNDMAVRLLGFDMDELLGQEFASILYPGNRDLFRNGLSSLVELKLEGRDGTPVDVSLRTRSFSIEGRKGSIVIVSETGQRIELERQRRLQHDLAVSLVGKQDLKEAAGLVLETAAEIAGFDGGALYLYYPDESCWRLSAFAGIGEAGLETLRIEDELSRTPEKFRNWLVFGDTGSGPKLPPPESMRSLGMGAAAAIPVFSEEQTVALVFIFCRANRQLDSERKRSLEIVASQFGSLVGRILSEGRLKSSEVFSRSLIRSMPSGLLVRNSEGIITHFNLAAEQLTGLKGSEVIGRKNFPEEFRVLDDSGRPVELDNFPTFLMLRNGESVHNMLLHAIRPDGSDVWLSINGEPLFRSGESPVAAVITMKDMSVLRRMVEELETARALAETASNSKSLFLANISHEIRTPLSGIMGMTDILLSGATGEEQRENLLLMKEAEESLLDIINKVLEISKIESGKVSLEIEPFRLRGAVNKAALPVFMGCREKGIALEISISQDVPDQLRGDGPRLTQVLTNFLSNALKFTDSGTITLAVRKKSFVEGGRVVLLFSVADTGIGIPRDQQEYIFEDFRQIDSGPAKKHQGTGLGLAISKKLVELMGGTIGVESEPGRGSRFFFSVPLSLPVDGEEPIPDQKEEESFEGRLRILLAEDNELNQRSITHFLQEAGHLVTVVGNGREAVEALEREPFDLVLMDVQMPVMDGMEATRTIREHRKCLFDPGIPIIALTAYALKEDELRFITAGMDRFVTKPVDRTQLFAAIHEMTGRPGGSPSLFHGSPGNEHTEDLYEFLRDYQSDLDIAGQILDLFIAEYPSKRDELRRAVAEGELETVVDLLHSFTNNLSALRVFGLGNECNLAEALAKEGDLREVSRRLIQLFPRLEQVHANALRCRAMLGDFDG